MYSRYFKILFSFILFLFLQSESSAQIYDTLITEPFNNTASMTSTETFSGTITSSTCANANMFNVTSDSRALDCVHYEPSSTVFVCSDKDAAGAGTGTASVEMLTYTAVDNDEIGFVGSIASYDYNALEASDVVELFYSTDNGSTYTSFLVLTGNSTDNPSYSAVGTGDGFSCSDGSAAVQTEFIVKEFSIGSGLSGQVIKIKVDFTGFTTANEGVVLDDFKLVKVRNILATEDFDNTTSLTTSGGVFSTPTEGGCNGSSLYDCTSNMGTPSNALNCLIGEDGDVFVMTGGGAATGEELEMLSYTAVDDKEISFRGNFASFGTDQNSDNFIVVAYSTDNGVSFTDAFTVTGIDGGSGTDWHSISDGTSSIGGSFITKGFVIGSNLKDSVIKIKVTYDTYTNSGDGIAIDKFILEGTLAVTLPIELIDFSAERANADVLLDWATASEINNDYFTLERSSDAINFEPIGTVVGAGNSNVQLNYNYIDPVGEANRIIYYRLKQTDFDGAFTYSRIRAVDLGAITPTDWVIYPNPAQQTLQVSGDIKSLEVRNILGELVQVEQNNQSFVDLTGVANGTYFIKVWFANGFVDVKKFVVSH